MCKKWHLPIVFLERHCHATEKSEAIAHCMCKDLPVIPVNKVVDQKRIIGKNGRPRRRRGTRGRGEAQGVADPKKRKPE
jgi:hypothetical protein